MIIGIRCAIAQGSFLGLSPRFGRTGEPGRNPQQSALFHPHQGRDLRIAASDVACA